MFTTQKHVIDKMIIKSLLFDIDGDAINVVYLLNVGLSVYVSITHRFRIHPDSYAVSNTNYMER